MTIFNIKQLPIITLVIIGITTQLSASSTSTIEVDGSDTTIVVSVQ